MAATVIVNLGAIDPRDMQSLALDALRGQLLVRLTEEGFDISPRGAPGNWTVILAGNATALDVEVTGSESRSERVAASPELELFHLEVTQRVIMAIRSTPPAAPANDGAPTRVAVWVDSQGSETERNRIRERTAVALVDAGFALTGGDDADLHICVDLAGDRIGLARAATRGDCGNPTRAVDRAGATIDDLADSVTREALSLASPEPRAAIAPPAASAPAALAATAHRAIGPTPRADAWRLEIEAAAGALVRGSAADPLLSLDASVGARRGPGARASLSLAPSSEDSLDVVELTATGGGGWRWLGPITLDAGVQGGIQVHRYRLAGEQAGTRVDWIAQLPLRAAVALSENWRLAAGANLGLAGRERSHVVSEGPILWHRDALQIAVTLGIGYRLP